MNFRSTRLALVAALVLPLGLASAGFAQDTAAPPPPPRGADAAARHHRDPAEMRAQMADRLRSVLQLQPGQDVALNAYLDALKPPGAARDHIGRQRGEMQHMTTPERLDRMAARLDEQRTRMLAKIAATRQFYTQLTPGQQKAFDDVAPMLMHRGGHGHGMDGHGDGHGGWGHDGDHGMGADGPPRG
jgi:periplasmic protein CpxP/Spy